MGFDQDYIARREQQADKELREQVQPFIDRQEKFERENVAPKVEPAPSLFSQVKQLLGGGPSEAGATPPPGEEKPAPSPGETGAILGGVGGAEKGLPPAKKELKPYPTEGRDPSVVKDTTGGLAQAMAGIIKGTTLGALDFEKGTMGVPFTNLKVKMGPPLGEVLRDYGMTESLTENSWAEWTGEMIGFAAPFSSLTRLYSQLGTRVLRTVDPAAKAAGQAFLKDSWNAMAMRLVSVGGANATLSQVDLPPNAGTVDRLRVANDAFVLGAAFQVPFEIASPLLNALSQRLASIQKQGGPSMFERSVNATNRAANQYADMMFANGFNGTREQAMGIAMKRVVTHTADQPVFGGKAGPTVEPTSPPKPPTQPTQPAGGPSSGPTTAAPLNEAQLDLVKSVRSVSRPLPFGTQTPHQLDRLFETENYAVVTAANPKVPTQFEGRDPSEVLVQKLLSDGFTKEDIIPVQTNEGEGFLVRGADAEYTKELLETFGQESAMVKGGMLDSSGNLTQSTGRTWGKDAESQPSNFRIGSSVVSEYLDPSKKAPHPELQQAAPTPPDVYDYIDSGVKPPSMGFGDTSPQFPVSPVDDVKDLLSQLPPETQSKLESYIPQARQAIQSVEVHDPDTKSVLVQYGQKVHNEAGPKWFGDLDEDGFARLGLVGLMGRTALGAAIGALEGDTPEERIENALIGAGVGAVSLPTLKLIAKLAASLVKRGKIGEVMDDLEKSGHADQLIRVFDPKGMKKPGVPSPVAAQTAPGAPAPQPSAKTSGSTTAQTSNTIEAPRVEVKVPLTEVKTGLTPEQIADFKKAYPSAINIGDKTLAVKWTNAQDPEALEAIHSQIVSLNNANIDKARRGTMTMDKIRELARKNGIDYEALVNRPEGGAFNAEDTLSSLMMLGSALNETNTVIQELATNPGNAELGQRMTEMLNITSIIISEVYGARAEWGRAGNVWRMNASGYIDVADRLMRNINSLAPGSTSVKEAVQKITPDRLAAFLASTLGDDLKKLSQYVEKASRPGWGDMLIETMYGGVFLSNPKTIAVNAMGTALSTTFSVPERMLASGVGQVFRGLEKAGVLAPSADHVYGSEVSAMLYGMVNAVPRALEIANHAFKTGERSSAGTKFEMIPESAITSENMGLGGPLAPFADFLGSVIRTMPRAMMATDEFAKVVNAMGYVYSDAIRSAKSAGLSGDAQAKHMVASLKNLTDLDKYRDYGDYMTFTQKGGFATSVTGWMNSLPPQYKIPIKFIFPFVATPVNLAKYSLERTPYAFASNHFYQEINAGGARRDLAVGKLLFGSLLIGAFAMLASEGKIVGKGPTKRADREVYKSGGFQDYSFVGKDGTQYAYDRLEPFGFIAGMGADWNGILYGNPDQGAIERALLMAVMPIAWNLTSKTYTKSAAEFFAAVSSGDMNTVNHFLKQRSGSLVPAIVRELNRAGFMNEQKLRHARDAWDEIISLVPGYSDRVKPETDIYGHDVFIKGGLGPDVISGIAVSKRKDEPHYAELVKSGVGLIPPGDSISGNPHDEMSRETADPTAGIQLTKDQQYRWRQLTGHETKISGKTFEENMKDFVKTDRWASATDWQRGVWVQGIHTQYKGKAQEELVKEFPELRDLRQQRAERIKKAVREKRTLE